MLDERIHNNIATRRRWLKQFAMAGTGALLGALPAHSSLLSSPDLASFVFTRLEYDIGDWRTDMLTEGMANGSEVNLLTKLNQSMHFNAYPREYSVRPDDERVFEHPFLYVTGHGDCDFTVTGRTNLRTILEQGGFLFADNCSGSKDVGFDRAIRTQLSLMFPETPLARLPMNHPLFHIYYQIDEILGGDKRLDPFLEGIEINGRLAVLYTRNDLGCAWEGHNCIPGGEPQRQHAFEMGINIILYALSGL